LIEAPTPSVWKAWAAAGVRSACRPGKPAGNGMRRRGARDFTAASIAAYGFARAHQVRPLNGRFETIARRTAHRAREISSVRLRRLRKPTPRQRYGVEWRSALLSLLHEVCWGRRGSACGGRSVFLTSGDG